MQKEIWLRRVLTRPGGIPSPSLQISIIMWEKLQTIGERQTASPLFITRPRPPVMNLPWSYEIELGVGESVSGYGGKGRRGSSETRAEEVEGERVKKQCGKGCGGVQLVNSSFYTISVATVTEKSLNHCLCECDTHFSLVVTLSNQGPLLGKVWSWRGSVLKVLLLCENWSLAKKHEVPFLFFLSFILST